MHCGCPLCIYICMQMTICSEKLFLFTTVLPVLYLGMLFKSIKVIDMSAFCLSLASLVETCSRSQPINHFGLVISGEYLTGAVIQRREGISDVEHINSCLYLLTRTCKRSSFQFFHFFVFSFILSTKIENLKCLITLFCFIFCFAFDLFIFFLLSFPPFSSPPILVELQ